jgi:Ca2+-transporting ATPase
MKKTKNYYQLSIEEVLSLTKSNLTGLISQEVLDRRVESGENVLSTKEVESPIWLFLKQFHNGLVYVLLLAAIISVMFDHWVDFWIIIVIIVINSIIGFSQEYRAERAVAALAKKISVKTKVYRDGHLEEHDAKDLVQGDIIILEEGDKVPADARLIESIELQTIEASLTGESQPSYKSIDIIAENVGIGDRSNLVWMGTLVATGWAKAVVVDTGMNTAIGVIADDLDKVEIERTHFHIQTDILAKQLAIFAFSSAAILFVIGFWFRQLPLDEMIGFTLSALVGGIPESLPIVLIVVLAIGAKRMSDKKAIIRSLPVTESLAVMDTIITDKTGTLTENNMTVQKIWILGEEIVDVNGRGLDTKGDFSQGANNIIPLDYPGISKLLHIAGLAHNGTIYQEILEDGSSVVKSVGDPTEVALSVVSMKSNLNKDLLDSDWHRLADLPFRSENKFRATYLHNISQDTHQLMAIGASETLLNLSNKILDKQGNLISLNDEHIQEINQQVAHLSKQAMRVIALAYKDEQAGLNSIQAEQVQDLVFVGLVGIIDPPRVEVSSAIAQAKQAGIRVIMATGDHKDTALAIAKSIGLIDETGQALTDAEIQELSDKELYKKLKTVSVLARLSPRTKMRVADILQKHKHIVAMTGDGVNDAPALKKADIGIAMGIRGTDVAREASDIVLTDDNFVSIISAVEEGRVIFRNVQQTSIFLITTSVAEILLFMLSLSLGLPLPLLAIQVLCLNLVTNGISDIALATERSHKNILLEKPLPVNMPVVSPNTYPYIIIMTLTMTALGFWIYISYLGNGIEQARTMFFLCLALMQLANTYNMRSPKESLFRIGFFSNQMINLAVIASSLILVAMIMLPFLQNILQFTPVSLYDAIYYGFISIIVVIAVAEFYKWRVRLERK